MSERPTKKQKELLSFIDGFIKGNGEDSGEDEQVECDEDEAVELSVFRRHFSRE